jgi:hypothetical protein
MESTPFPASGESFALLERHSRGSIASSPGVRRNDRRRRDGERCGERWRADFTRGNLGSVGMDAALVVETASANRFDQRSERGPDGRQGLDSIARDEGKASFAFQLREKPRTEIE